MMVVPAAAASMLTDRLPMLILISALIGATSAVLGHVTAITVPEWFGFGSTSTAGMMALMSGLLFSLVVVFSPKSGLLFNFVRRQQLAFSILGEDVLAYVYRYEENGEMQAITCKRMQKKLISSTFATSIVLAWYRWRGMLLQNGDQYGLSDSGRASAALLVRSHRLWEQYLVDQAGVATDRIHGQAERLEHFTGRKFRDELERQTAYPSSDPHGRPIPAERMNTARMNTARMNTERMNTERIDPERVNAHESTNEKQDSENPKL